MYNLNRGPGMYFKPQQVYTNIDDYSVKIQMCKYKIPNY